MRHFVILITALFFIFSRICPANEIGEIICTSGFVYRPLEDIYSTRLNAPQRLFGYKAFFDELSSLGGMALDSEPVIFSYKNKLFMIELWKGQYKFSAGCEIGFYVWNHGRWETFSDKELLYVSYVLTKNNEPVFARDGIHWWLTGFLPGLFADPSELTMKDIFINFNNSLMRDKFLFSLYNLGYNNIHDNIEAPPYSSTIKFTFNTPKSIQPQDPFERYYLQFENRISVEAYNIRKAEVGKTDNSPETLQAVFFPES